MAADARSRRQTRGPFSDFLAMEEPEPEGSWFDTIASGALRVVPSAVGTYGGGLGAAALAGPETAFLGSIPAGAAGAAAGGAAGGAAGEWLAEKYEQARGLRKDVSPTSIGIEGFLGAIPLGKSATIAKAAAKGAAMSAGGTTLHSLLEQGELPSAGSVAASGGLGALFGAGGEYVGRRLFPEKDPHAGLKTGDDIDFEADPSTKPKVGLPRGSFSEYLKRDADIQAQAAEQRAGDASYRDTLAREPWGDEADLVARSRDPNRPPGWDPETFTKEDFAQPLQDGGLEDPDWLTSARRVDAENAARDAETQSNMAELRRALGVADEPAPVRPAADEAPYVNRPEAHQAELTGALGDLQRKAEADALEKAAAQRRLDAVMSGVEVHHRLMGERKAAAAEALKATHSQELRSAVDELGYQNATREAAGIDWPMPWKDVEALFAEHADIPDHGDMMEAIRSRVADLRNERPEVVAERQQALHEIQGEVGQPNGRGLLEAIRKAGGLRRGAGADAKGHGGEARWLDEFRDVRAGGGAHAGTVGGVANVLTNDGMLPDQLVEHLTQEAGFPDITVQNLYDKIAEAKRNVDPDYRGGNQAVPGGGGPTGAADASAANEKLLGSFTSALDRERGAKKPNLTRIKKLLSEIDRLKGDLLGDTRGEVSSEIAGTLGGAAFGGLAGGTQGDTTEERWRNAAIGAGLGAAGGSQLGRLGEFLGSKFGKAAEVAAGATPPEGPEHVVIGARGVADTAPGINPEGLKPAKGIRTTTGTYTAEGPAGTIDMKTGKVRRARSSSLFSFMGGEAKETLPKAVTAPKAQREDLGFDRFPQELREGLGQIHEDVGEAATEAQRRYRQPNERTLALARQMKMSVTDKVAPGTNLPAAGHAAHAEMVASIQDKLRTLGQKIQKDGGSDVDLLELGKLNAAQRVAFLSYAGLRAEAGRALQIYSAMKRVMPSEIRLVREMLDRGRLRGDTQDFAKVAANLSSDPVKAFEELRQHETRSLGQRVADYYMANILSGIKTQERNILGNASKLAARVVVKGATGGLDALSSMVSGKPRTVYASEVLHEVQGGLAGISKAWEDFTETMRLGFSPSAIREGLSGEGAVYLPKQELPFAGKNPLNYPGRLLESADRFFRQINGSMELYGLTYSRARQIAEKENLTGGAFTDRVSSLMTGMRLNPSDELKGEIQKAAERATFQEDPGAAINTLIGLKKQVPALNYVIPFVRTVSNIMKQGAEHTPLGFLMKRARDSSNIREQTIARGEAMLGTLAMAPIAYYAATGQISGSGPSDPAKRAALYESGWRPNSIKLGDKWVSYGLAQPFSIPLSIIANGFEAYQESSENATEKSKLQSAENIVAQTVARVGKSALDQSFLSGLGDLVKAINDPERASSGFVARLASGFVPLSGAMRNVAQFVDPTVRQPEGVIDSIKAGIPGASFGVAPRINRFGEESTRSRASAVLVPETVSETDDPVSDELTRLGLDIGLPSDRIKFDERRGPPRQLTQDESLTLRQTRGRATRVILASIMNQPGYGNLPDVLKAELLHRALRRKMGRVNDVARTAIQGGRPDLLHELSAPLEEQAAQTYGP